jgi:hypothetical protein
MIKDDRRVVEGFKLPSNAPITANERDRIDMLQWIFGEADPPPSLAVLQALCMVLTNQ